MVLGLVYLALGTALAAGPAPVGPKHAPTLEEYISELEADRRSDRLYAVRELRRQVRQAVRESQRRSGSLRQAEALQSLALYDELLAPKCLLAVPEHEELRPSCADILRYLQTESALQPLQQALELEQRGWALRKIERAMEAIEDAKGPA